MVTETTQGATGESAEALARPASAVGCCDGPAATTADGPETTTCCGTVAEARESGGCCGASARTQAVAAGAGCCG